jgi:hypothetical protein
MMDQDYLSIASEQVHHPAEVDLPSCPQQTIPSSTIEDDCGVFVFDGA